MKRFEIIEQDRDLLVKFFTLSATSDPNARSPELKSLMADGHLDDFPMLQLVAFMRKEFADKEIVS